MGTSPVVRSTTSALLERTHRHLLATTAHHDRTRSVLPAYRFRPMRREADLAADITTGLNGAAPATV